MRFAIPIQERIMRRVPNATFVNSRKRARESVVSWSDGSNAVHTYGSLCLSKGEGRVRIYSPQLATCKAPIRRARLWIAWINRNWRSSVDALPASRRLAHCRNLVETLTLVLSRCERERRATRDERKDPQRGCTRPPRPACGERIEVRVILLSKIALVTKIILRESRSFVAKEGNRH